MLPAEKPIHVLSIDGGGIRGIIPAVILKALRERIGKDLYRVFDLMAGTSTGGIIAAALATACHHGRPYQPDELLEFYVSKGPGIFRKHWYTPLRQLLRPKYSALPLERILQDAFGDARLGSALTPLLVSSYDLQAQIPFFFKSHKIARDSNYDWEVWKVARATSAAPTFFPPFHLQRGREDYALVDGGIFVNNPAMAAYAEARRLYPTHSEFLIVSVGTGDRHDDIRYASARRWGLLCWARQIVPVMMDSVSEAVDYELDSVTGATPRSRHYRFQPELTIAANAIDDASPKNLEHLRQQAQAYVQAFHQRLEDVATQLRQERASAMPGIGYAAGVMQA